MKSVVIATAGFAAWLLLCLAAGDINIITAGGMLLVGVLWAVMVLPENREQFELQLAEALLKGQGITAGWLICNGQGGDAQRFRAVDDLGFSYWTENQDIALRFCRRADAEQFAAGDEDAWRIIPQLWFTSGQRANGELCRHGIFEHCYHCANEEVVVEIEGLGACMLPVRSGVVQMPATTVADIVSKSRLRA